MAREELFSQLSLWIVNLFTKWYTFCLNFIIYWHGWIRIHESPEYGSNMDPDQQHWLCYKNHPQIYYVEWFSLFAEVWRKQRN